MDYTNTMRSLTKKMLTLALLLSFAVAQTAFAQDASGTPVTPASADSSSAVPPVVTTDTPPAPPTDTSTTLSDTSSASTASSTVDQLVDLQGSTATLQDTTNTQSAASSTLLENTTDPATATSTDVVSIPVVEATTSTSSNPSPVTVTPPPATTDETTPVDQGTSTLDIVAQNVDPVTPEDAATSTPAPVGVPHLTVLPLADLTPQPAYTFALTGTNIPSVRKMKDASGAVVGEEAVATPLTPQIDTTTGAVSVSGQCSAAYFVVLLFKHSDDYANDSRSYVVNRAYPCVNGAFTYSISELPSTLADGNYYLLVGQEGKRGTWEPITEMTEIAITKKH